MSDGCQHVLSFHPMTGAVYCGLPVSQKAGAHGMLCDAHDVVDVDVPEPLSMA